MMQMIDEIPTEPTERPDVTAWLSTYLAAAVCLLPFATLVPLYGWPGGIAAGNSPTVFLHLLGVLLIAALVWREDRWLGAFAAYIALDALRSPAPAIGRAWQMADAVALGALLYVYVRKVPEPWAGRVRTALGASGIIQAAIAGLQYLGRDPFYEKDAPFQTAGTMVGTLGNDTWLGAYLAVVGAVAPWWMVPFAGIGLLFARNRLGLIALAAALLVRCYLAWHAEQVIQRPGGWYMIAEDRRRTYARVALLVAVLLTPALWLIDKTTDTLYARLHVWRKGLTAWWEHGILFGRGPGVWAWDVRQLELPEHFGQMHSDALQLLYETGLVGLALIVCWTIAHRRELLANPAAWALAILCAAFFPFHVAQVAGPALVAVAIWPRAES